MPQLTAILQVALLLSAVPAQYLLSRWTSGTAAQRSLATQGILDTLKWVKESYLNIAVWVDWLNSWVASISHQPKPTKMRTKRPCEQIVSSDWSELSGAGARKFFGIEEEMDFRLALEETFSLELMMQNNDHGYFGVSEEPRSPRPEYVLHRVGEVIMETQNNMVGVIVGWDIGLRAPPQWIKRKKYTDSEVQKLEDTPHYRILFSGPDQSSLLIGYVPQTAIHRFDGLQPDIPTLDNYFYHFDGKRFVMQEWLKERYPED